MKAFPRKSGAVVYTLEWEGKSHFGSSEKDSLEEAKQAMPPTTTFAEVWRDTFDEKGDGVLVAKFKDGQWSNV